MQLRPKVIQEYGRETGGLHLVEGNTRHKAFLEAAAELFPITQEKLESLL